MLVRRCWRRLKAALRAASVPGARARVRSRSRADVLDPADVRAALGDLGRAEQRVEVRVEPDVDVDRPRLELPEPRAGRRRTAAGDSGVTFVWKPNARQSAATASATAIAVGFDAASGAISSITYGVFVPGAAQPPGAASSRRP